MPCTGRSRQALQDHTGHGDNERPAQQASDQQFHQVLHGASIESRAQLAPKTREWGLAGWGEARTQPSRPPTPLGGLAHALKS